MAPRTRIGVRGPHRDVGQRTLSDLVESWKEQSSGQLEEQRNRSESHPVQGMISTLRRSPVEPVGVKLEAVHSICPWIAQHAGFLLTRFEVGRDGKLRGKSAEVQGMKFPEGMLRKRKQAGGPLGTLTCMWEERVHLVNSFVGDRGGVCLASGVRRKSQGERDDPDMDGEKLKGEVVVVNRDGKKRLGREEHVPVPKRRVHITRENLDEFGFTARCLGFMSWFRRTARQAHTEDK